ncbi:HAD family hydrolase [Nostoc sp. CALU 546]|uniref:HAD family hydrolase n=1 Tax=Nostoc sp. CALU 546 TaxID=1867241 RepID=UPI003B683672
MTGVIFDLDGTLWNISSICASAWNQAINIAKIQRTPITEDDISRVSGLPFIDCVKNIFPELAQESIYKISLLIEDCEKQEIKTRGGSLYKGVSEYLDTLSAQFPLFVVSNCEYWYLQAFLSMPLNSSNTSKTFGDIFIDSECFGRTQKPKAENIIAICQRNSLKNAIYIGDTESDRLAAMKAGVDFIHVTYGFGYVESENIKTAASFSEVVDMLLTIINLPSVAK